MLATTRNEAVPIQSYAHYSESSDSSSYHLRTLQPGVYVPTFAFFHADNENLDLKTTAEHAVRLARAGVKGITTQGSSGEAVHMSHGERRLVTATTRNALDRAGFRDIPIIVGCGAQSTRESIEHCLEAYAAGGDYALILPPSYYRNLHDKDTVINFFIDVANASPLPILIYNFPSAAGGVDLSSDAIIELSRHSNVVGCKLTCGNTGKLNRIATGTGASTTSELGSGFMCMGGSADFTLQTMVGGGSGIIGGLANIAPKVCVKLIGLIESEQMEDARKLQAIIARGDWAAIQGGIVGMRSAMQSYFGYGGYCRNPLPRPDEEETRRWKEAFEEIVAMERSF